MKYRSKARGFPEEGKLLWEWRVEHRITREDLSFLAGVGHNVLCKFELGLPIKPSTAEAILETWASLKADPGMIKAFHKGRKLPPIGVYQKGKANENTSLAKD